MDDFHLSAELRPTNKLSERKDGSGFYLKRILSQVIKPYLEGRSLKYQKYDWVKNKVEGEFEIP